MASKISILEIVSALRQELDSRRRSNEPGDFSHHRERNDVPLYAVTGAANLYAQLGLWLGDLRQRQAWAGRINAFQQPDGAFQSPSGREHAAAMAIIALNLLGSAPARPVRHLAPTTSEKLDAWIKALNWSSTHKALGMGAAPILASGFYDGDWIRTLRRNVESRLSPDRPLETWCTADAAPATVISCVYHVLESYDAGYLSYPQPQMLWDRLMGLQYDTRRNDLSRTICTDFDYAFLLERLCHQLPGRFPDFIRACGNVLEQRLAEWREQRERVFAECSTHDLYCYVVGWAIFQRILPDQFEGPGLLDTLNAPWVFRLPSRQFLAEDEDLVDHSEGFSK